MTDNNSNTSSTELSDLSTLKPFDMEPRRKSAVKTLHSANVNPKFIISEFCFRVLWYAACKQYTCWIHSRLGKGVRKVIASCALWAICDKFPLQDNKCVNFVESIIITKLRLATS